MTLLERLRALPPAGQLSLAGAAAVLIALVLGGVFLATRPDYDVLFTDLRQADAATIVAELEKDKTPYRLDDGGATILAPADRIDQIRLEIMGADLPLKGTVGFELFNKSDMGVTEFAQRINYQRAIQGELARTIMTIDAIDTARVHLTLPEPSIFRAERKPAKASVSLVTRPGRILEPATVAGVQRLVAASVPDLEPTSVVILDARGSLAAGGIAAAAATGTPETATSASVHQTRAIEQYYVAALRRAVDPLYPGARIAVVAPVDQWAAVPEDREAALAAWRPGAREFRLRVEIATPNALSADQQDDLGQIVAEVTDWSTERGDQLIFPAWSGGGELVETARPAASAPADAAPAPAVRPTPRDDAALFAWIAGGLIALAGAVLVFRRRRPAGRALTPDERDAYVRRLQRLLAEDAGHGG